MFQEHKRQYSIAEDEADEALRQIEEEYGAEAKEHADKVAAALDEILSNIRTNNRGITKDEFEEIVKEHKFSKVDFAILHEYIHPGSELGDLVESDDERQHTHKLIEDAEKRYEKLDTEYRKFYAISIFVSVLIVVVLYIFEVNASGKEWTTAADIATVVGFVTMLLTKAIADVYERYLEVLKESFDKAMEDV